jgi:hypothetical protein
MARWWRSLPADLRTLIDGLAAEQALSGYNLMARTDLRLLAAESDPIIVPGNPGLSTVSSFAAATGDDADINLTWTLAPASGDSYAHVFYAGVNPDTVAGDPWTYASGLTDTLTNLDGSVTVPDLTPVSDYYVVMVLTDAATFGASTLVAGGVGANATSAPSS